MQEILIMGAGHIGTLVAALLALTGEYQVHLADSTLKPLSPIYKIQLKFTYSSGRFKYR